MALIPQFCHGGIGPESSPTVFGLMIDPSKYTHQTRESIRQQADQSEVPGEHSLSPHGLWRRSQESWHHGAGQVLLDGKASGTAADPERFYSSSGIDPWTKGQLTLLKDVTRVRAQRYGRIVTAGNYVYVTDLTAQQVYWSSNPTTTGAIWTSMNIHAGQPAQDPQYIATNGTHVWVALGISGLHRAPVGSAVSTADVPATELYGVFYANGRLLATAGNVLYEITNPLGAAAAVAIMTHDNPSFVWRGVGPGRGCIYAWGNGGGGVLDLSYGMTEGGTGEIYKITIEPVGTGLAPGSQATYLPDGEEINNVQFYAGGILLCTGRGFRVGVADAAGNIDYGPLITTAKPVVALEPQDRYAWFSSRNGLARADLGYFTDTLTPAWADDLQETIDDNGLTHSAGSVTTAPSLVFFHYAGTYTPGSDPSGVYRQSSNFVPSGNFRTGQIRFGTTDKKQARHVDIKHLPLPAGSTIAVEIALDGGAFVAVGTSAGTGATSAGWSFSSAAAETFELRFTLTRGTVATTAPTLLRWTLKALPIPVRDKLIRVPIILKSYVDNGVGDGAPIKQTVTSMMSMFTQWERDSTVLLLQIGDDIWTGYIVSLTLEGQYWNDDPPPRRFVEGMLYMDFATVNG